MFKQLFNKIKGNIVAALPIAQLANAPLDEKLLTIQGISLKARHYRSYIIALIMEGRISRFISPKKNLEIWNDLQLKFQNNPRKTLNSLEMVEQKIQNYLQKDSTLQQYYLGNSMKNAIIAQGVVYQLGNSISTSDSGLSNQDIIDGCMPSPNYDY